MFSFFFEFLKNNFGSKKNKVHYPDEILVSINELQKKINKTFVRKGYYIKALTHRSYLELYPELSKSNERLEFLGDSVLNMLVAKYLFYRFIDEDEGFLTKSRSALVNRFRLAAAAKRLNLQKYLKFNQKYVKDNEDGFDTIMADSLEALIGALFVDLGIDQTEEFVKEFIIHPFEEDETFIKDTNYKGQLLEYTHAQKMNPPQYVLVSSEGPSHKKEFIVEVFVGGQSCGLGSGKNKKTAEQNASREALLKFNIIPID